MRRDWKRILRHVPPDRRFAVRQKIREEWLDVVTTNWPVVESEPNPETGLRQLRFWPDPVVRGLVDDLCLDGVPVLQRLRGPKSSMRAFYRRLGYSLGGFAEVFHL